MKEQKNIHSIDLRTMFTDLMFFIIILFLNMDIFITYIINDKMMLSCSIIMCIAIDVRENVSENNKAYDLHKIKF